MQQVWYTIEALANVYWSAEDNAFVSDEDAATEYDEYNDAALVAEGLRDCVVIRHRKAVGGVEHTEVAGEF